MTTNEIDDVATRAHLVPEDGTPAPPAAGRYVTTPREDLVTVVLAALMVGGLLSDAWAHSNIVETIESFFTPWHALLYSGFAALAGWTFWLAYRRRSVAPRWWRDGWPVGYLIGGIGVVGFMVGGMLDSVWHTVFGVEASLAITFSPSHLLLAFSATLMLSSPLRSWWATGESGLRTVTGVLSLALTPVFGAVLFTTYSAFASTAPTRAYDHVSGSPSHLDATLGMGAYLVTTVLLTVMLLLVHRRRTTPGAATAIVAVIALFDATMFAFPAALTGAAVGAIVGAALADTALLRLDRARGLDAPLRLPIAGAVFAALVWSGHLLGIQLTTGIAWPPELWAGTVVVAAFIAAGLGVLAAPIRSRV